MRGVPVDKRRGRMREAIHACGLGDRVVQPIGTLSKGYRQRVGLAQAIIHEPDILILDEPTTGLDPTQIVEIRELIKALAQHSTVLLSTHILSEVEASCSRVVVIAKGKLVAEGSLETIEKKRRSVGVVVVARGPVDTKALEGKAPRKVIIVPQRIVNVVA